MTSKVKHRQPKKLSIPELLEAAERSQVTGDPNHAVKLLTIAIEKIDRQKQQEDTTELLLQLLERRSELYVSLQNSHLAAKDYKRCLDVLESSLGTQQHEPSNEWLQRNAAIHMYLGQLSTGMEALNSYQKGIDCLLAQKRTIAKHSTMETEDEDNEDKTHQEQLAAAYTSMAELYLTDLCFEETAETSCQQNLKLALECDPNSVDALQTLASLELSQAKPQDAKCTIRRVYDQLQAGCRAMANLVGLRDEQDQQGATELMELDSVQALPMFEFRCQTAKLLLETGQPAAAIDVIGSLLAENDQVIEIWVLAGDAFHALGQDKCHQDTDGMNVQDEDSPLQIHYWERAVEMLVVVKGNVEQQLQDDSNDHNKDDEDDLQQQLDQVEALLDETRAKIEEANLIHNKDHT